MVLWSVMVQKIKRIKLNSFLVLFIIIEQTTCKCRSVSFFGFLRLLRLQYVALSTKESNLLGYQVAFLSTYHLLLFFASSASSFFFFFFSLRFLTKFCGPFSYFFMIIIIIFFLDYFLIFFFTTSAMELLKILLNSTFYL